MPRTLSSRIGAFGLALLMQVFVVSALLHPCCLTGDMAPVASAESPEAGDAHAAMGHAAPHTSGSAASAGAHSGHSGHDGSDDSGCEGRCGFCCQVAGFGALPAPLVASISAAEIAAALIPLPAATVRGSDTAYLLPWATAPPVRFDIV